MSIATMRERPAGVHPLVFLMIRRPPRSTPLYSSAASDVYKRQADPSFQFDVLFGPAYKGIPLACLLYTSPSPRASQELVCRLPLAKKKNGNPTGQHQRSSSRSLARLARLSQRS